MWPDLYDRIKPGAPPHSGNIPEFEIIPTRQLYWALPIAEATKKNLGKTKLDAKGYLIGDSWAGGVPFPKPSGPFKAQQIMYNLEKRMLAWELNFYIISHVIGVNSSLNVDFDGGYDVKHVRLAGRTLMEPYGWFDKRAKERNEFKTFMFGFQAPRDVAGVYQQALYSNDQNTADQLMLYIPSMRRVRKMSATDTQDPVMGQDQIYDDNEGWMQKLSATRYPYKYEVLEEREYLVPAATADGAEYISSKGKEFRNVRMERQAALRGETDAAWTRTTSTATGSSTSTPRRSISCTSRTTTGRGSSTAPGTGTTGGSRRWECSRGAGRSS